MKWALTTSRIFEKSIYIYIFFPLTWRAPIKKKEKKEKRQNAQFCFFTSLQRRWLQQFFSLSKAATRTLSSLGTIETDACAQRAEDRNMHTGTNN